jgi:hypothetical protein
MPGDVDRIQANGDGFAPMLHESRSTISDEGQRLIISRRAAVYCQPNV